MPEINYFDTPYERRKGNTGFAKFMDGILKAKEKREKLEKLNEDTPNGNE